MDEKLQERIKQFDLAARFAKEMYAELGKERALEILAKAYEKLAIETGRNEIEKLGSNSFDAWCERCKRNAARSPDSEVVEATDKYVQMKITRCISAEAFESLGTPELCRVYCDSDWAMIKAFNPKMTLVRTKTLANGDECCDHRWMLEE